MVVGILRHQGWITEAEKEAFGIPEHSSEPLDKSLTQLVQAGGTPYAKLAMEMRVSSTTIYKYMNGYTKLIEINEDISRKMKFLRKIADYFDIKPSYFREYRIVKLIEKMEENPELIDIFLELSKKAREVIRKYNELNPYRDLNINRGSSK